MRSSCVWSSSPAVSAPRVSCIEYMIKSWPMWWRGMLVYVEMASRGLNGEAGLKSGQSK